MIPTGTSSAAEHTETTHILYLIDQLCEMGGAERVLLNMVRLLPKDRFRCSVATFKVDTRLGILEDLPCPLHIFGLRRTYDLSALRVARKLRALVRSQNVAIVHTFFETSDLWGGLVAKLSRVPLLVSSRRDMGILRSGKHELGYRVLKSQFDLVLAVSEEVRNFCIQHDRLDPHRVVTLYNGLELDKIQNTNGTDDLRCRMGVADASHLIATVAYIRRVKGIDVMIRSAEIVCREFPQAVFLVMGPVSEPGHFQELQNLVRSFRLSQNFRFLGNSEKIYDLLKMCDVFCLLSRSEGFSNALIEAMACGLPCVATRVGGNGEALEDELSGYLVEREDAVRAAERILTLLRNRGLASKMGNAGRKIVEQKFTAEVMIRNLVRAYDELLAAKRK